MHEKADLREANLNGAILADAKLGGARLDEGFYFATYTALVTPRTHRDDFRPDGCHGATGAYRLPSGPRHPYGFDADIANKLETNHRDANFGAPSQRGFLVKD